MSAPIAAAALVAETESVPQPSLQAGEQWSALLGIALRASVDIALPPMSIRALRALEPGQVLASDVPTSEDLPVLIGGALVAWARFECIDDLMSVRVTRLA